MGELSINDRIAGTIEMLREIGMGGTPWLDAQDAKVIIPVLRDALTTIQGRETEIEVLGEMLTKERERCAKIADDYELVEGDMWCPGSEMSAYQDGQEWAANAIRDRILATQDSMHAEPQSARAARWQGEA